MVLGPVVALIIWGLVTGSRIPDSARSDDPDQTDAGLYAAIIDRMNDGEGYYVAVAAEQPSRGYPISPAVNVREPTLAWTTSVVGESVMVGLMWLLALMAIGLSVWIYGHTERNRTALFAVATLSAMAIGIFTFPGGVHVHEVWLSLLIYVALLARGVGMERASMVLVLLAALVRELVAPVLVIMLVISWVTGRKRAAVGWLGCLAVFGAFYAVHLVHVHQLVTGPSLESPTWVALGGWPFVVDAVRASSILAAFPFWVAAFLVPIGLLGWVSRRGHMFDAVAAHLVCYSTLFCVVGRPNNAYWGTFIGVFLVPGIVFGMGYLVGLVRPTKAGTFHVS